MADLLNSDQRLLLTQKLIDTFVTIDVLTHWLEQYFTRALCELGTGNLRIEITNLMTSSNAQDGMQTLLQKFCDHPPGNEIPAIIYALTLGAIKSKELMTNHGLPQVPAHQSWFAADRPFVNRSILRQHLRELETSAGAQSILVIDGNDGTGKSFAVSLALGFEAARKSQPPLDIDEFAKFGAELNAREFAVLIAGDVQGCPPFDITKEDEAVPHIMFWLTSKLRGRNLWIIIDHCNRRVLTRGARSILKVLATRLRNGELPAVRLILVDFDRNELPEEWRALVRHDRAELPGKQHVEEWCRQMATGAKRLYEDTAPAQWASEVFDGLDGYSQTDGSWQVEFEHQLRQAVDRIKACEEQP